MEKSEGVGEGLSSKWTIKDQLCGANFVILFISSTKHKVRFPLFHLAPQLFFNCSELNKE